MLAIEYVQKNISRKGWFLFLVGEFFFISSLVLGFVIPLAQKELINSAMSDSSDILGRSGIFCVVLAFVMGLATTVSVQFSGKSFGEAHEGLSMRTFERMMGHKPAAILKKGTSWYRMVIADESLLSTLNSVYSGAAFSIVQFFAILIIAGKWSISLVYVILAICIVYILMLVFFSHRREKYGELDKREFLKVAPIIQEGFDAVKTFSRFGKKDVLFARLRAQIGREKAYMVKSNIAVGVSSSFEEIMPSLIMVSLVVSSISALQRGAINTGDMVTLVAYIPQILLPCKLIGQIFMMEASYAPIKMRYIEAQKQYEDTIPETFSIPVTRSDETMKLRDIGFSYTTNAVSGETADGKAGPRSSETEAPESVAAASEVDLAGISLTCAEGSSTALLGLSGEGKSTIIKLMTGEESPAAGEVLFCGVPIASLPVPVQYAFINAYSQETEILDDDALGNILVGKEMIAVADVEATKEKLSAQFSESLSVLRVCVADTKGKDEKKQQNALFREVGKKRHELLRCILGLPLLSRLPVAQETGLVAGLLRDYTDEAIARVLAEAEFGRSYCVKERVDALIQATGIAHLLGRKLGERGAGISGGERQRIALARCLAKENWKFLIIDEPFTSLDALAEDELAGVLRDYTRGKTLLLVTHKLNLVPLLTERVVLLEEGVIAAEGTHEALKSGNALYASLWKAFSAQRQ
ncbi:MAG: ABC transporter ATP-binding protein [Rectinemataceae bacterium]